jgi:hypothetical protein
MLKRNLLDDNYCQGVSFSITDEDALSRAIALVLVQEYALAKSILTGDTGNQEDATVVLDDVEIEDIVNRRLKPSVVYHRDGFLFQLMMWLATHIDLDDGDLVALPHAQATAKGQDSLVVHRANGALVALSICEEKATENPRKTVRDEVWPEIKDYEAGGRRDELRSNVIATLGLGGIPADQATALVRRISWEGKRRYRVRVTVETERDKKLFRGFDEVVSGEAGRRRGETVEIPQLRDWMIKLAGKVETELRGYGQVE